MMMWLIAMILGVLIGLIYLGSLWLMVRQLIIWQRGAVLFNIARIARMGILASLFYFLCRQGAALAVAALAGFWVARYCVLMHVERGSYGK
jgi:F1F0 ATPase subunit 2